MNPVVTFSRMSTNELHGRLIQALIRSRHYRLYNSGPRQKRSEHFEAAESRPPKSLLEVTARISMSQNMKKRLME